MRLLKIRINYNSIDGGFYSGLLCKVADMLNFNNIKCWVLNKGWENGPHFNFLINMESEFYNSSLIEDVKETISNYLLDNPSDEYDKVQYFKKQKKLSELEKKNIVHDFVFDNNSYSVCEANISEIYQNYENPEQMESVFNVESTLSNYIIKTRSLGEDPLDVALKVMLMTACTFSPSPSPLEGVDEYNGFLSFKANYKFWIHNLNDDEKKYIENEFSTKCEDFKLKVAFFMENVSALDFHFSTFVNGMFVHFSEMARKGVIHERSPYPLNLLKPKKDLSDYHKSLFYNDDGSIYRFPNCFSGYRWLMNVVYKNLPLIGCSAMDRQFLNYLLFNFDNENRGLISDFRKNMKVSGI